jgi:hypothetical protein
MNHPEQDAFDAPPYTERRLFIDVGGISLDVAPIQQVECWHEAFPDGTVDWREGWRKLSLCARGRLGTGTGFRFGQTRIAYEFGFRQRVDQKQR